MTSSALEVLPSLAWHYDEPFADSSAIPTFYVSQLSSQHVTVVLTGDGGDESFGGYMRYLAMARSGRLPVPGALRPGLRSLSCACSRRGTDRGSRGRHGCSTLLSEPPCRRYARLVSCFMPEQKLRHLHRRTARTSRWHRQLPAHRSRLSRHRASPSLVGKIMDVDIHTYLPGDILVKLDIATMACSLEARCPFLDHHLMEWSAGLPAAAQGPQGNHEVPAEEGDGAVAATRAAQPEQAGLRRADGGLAANRLP